MAADPFTQACAVLARDPSFRLFAREFLSSLRLFEIGGMAGNPFTSNALTTAHESGKMAAGQEFVRLVAAAAPDFYINLLKDEFNAQRADRTDLRPDGRTLGTDDDAE